MARQGPCSHCGINQTCHWRRGPPEKPVLCNACGSRWQSRGTLHDYMPRHANREIPRYQLLSELTPCRSARNVQKQEVGVEVSGQDGSSAREEKMKNISSLDAAGSSSINCMQMEETNDKDALINPGSVTKRKRSELTQLILSPFERLQMRLYNNIQKPDFENTPDGEEDVTLIYARNHYTPTNEIGLGAMLLISPANASSSTNVPVENPYRINNNAPDNVARQSETTGNERGKAKARENSLAPHHMDTTSRVSGQELHFQRDGPQIGSQVKRPRGRPRLYTTQGRFLDKDRKSGTADDSSQA